MVKLLSCLLLVATAANAVSKAIRATTMQNATLPSGHRRLYELAGVVNFVSTLLGLPVPDAVVDGFVNFVKTLAQMSIEAVTDEKVINGRVTRIVARTVESMMKTVGAPIGSKNFKSIVKLMGDLEKIADLAVLVAPEEIQNVKQLLDKAKLNTDGMVVTLCKSGKDGGDQGATEYCCHNHQLRCTNSNNASAAASKNVSSTSTSSTTSGSNSNSNTIGSQSTRSKVDENNDTEVDANDAKNAPDGMVLYIVLAAGGVVILLITAVLCYTLNRKGKNDPQNAPPPLPIEPVELPKRITTLRTHEKRPRVPRAQHGDPRTNTARRGRPDMGKKIE